MSVVQKCFICFYDWFLDRSCLLPVSLGRISLTVSCTKKASKFATRNQKLSLKLSKDIGDAVHSSKIKGGSCQNHPTRPETGKNVKHLEKPNACLFHSFPTHSHRGFFGGKWKEYRRKGLGKPLGKSQVEYHFVGCHKEENYSKGMGVPCTPQKPEGAAARTTQVAQKLEKTSKTQKNRMLALFHSFPSRVLWVEMKGISEKKVGKTTGKEPRWMPSCGISQGET